MEKWNVSIWNRVRFGAGFGAGFGETDGIPYDGIDG